MAAIPFCSSLAYWRTRRPKVKNVKRGKWANRDTWRRRQQGMTEEQVIALLGKPRTMTEVGRESQWYCSGGDLAGETVVENAVLSYVGKE